MKLQKLNTKKHEIVRPKLNKLLRKLISIDSYRYIKRNQLPYVQDGALASYQSDVLKHHLDNFKLDIDKLDFTIKCNRKANGTSELISDLLTKLKVGIYPIGDSVISITEVSVGDINKNTKLRNSKKRPWYTVAFKIVINGDVYKTLKLYISEGIKENSTAGLRFSFNPNHFTNKEICMLFMYIQSLLGSRTYAKLIARARVTRLDLGINLFGLCSLYAFTVHTSEKLISGNLYPTGGHVAETVQHGIYSMLKIYDKLLEVAKAYSSGINNLAFTTRIEHQNRVGSKVYLTELETCSQLLQKLHFIDPIDLIRIEPSIVKTLLKKRTHARASKVIEVFNAKDSNPIELLSLNSKHLSKQHNNRLKMLKKLILEPKKHFKQLHE